MISSASSFQRRQPHPVSITLAPGNPRRTFAFTKFRRTFRRAFPAKPCTSSANGHRYEVYFVELNAVMWWIARFWCRLRHLPQLRRVTPATPLQLRWALPSPSFLAEGEHTIALASSISFRFSIHVHVWRSSPSNLYLPSFLCSVVVTMTEVQSAVCRPPSLPPPIAAISATPCRRWGSPRIPLHLLPQFCTLYEALGRPHRRRPERQELPCVSCSSQDGGRRQGRFMIRTLDFLVILRSNLVSWSIYRKPPTKTLAFTHKPHLSLFQI
jgi:hypothetical protein